MPKAWLSYYIYTFMIKTADNRLKMRNFLENLTFFEDFFKFFDFYMC